MATLDAQDLAVLVAESGWFDNDSNASKNIDTAVAIALAESGGKTDAVSSTGDYGLWQINKKAHPGLFSLGDWKDPKVNAQMAASVYRAAGNSFKPWVTYNSGAYKSHTGNIIPRSDAPNSARADLGNAADKVVVGPAKVVAGALGDVMKWITKGFVTIGAFIAALSLLSFGIWLLVKDTKTGKIVQEGATDAAVAAVTKGVVK